MKRRSAYDATRCLAILAGLALPGAGDAAAADRYLRGTVSVTGLEDDNIFFTSGQGEGDRIARLTPEIEAGCDSARLSVLGRYTLDAERFAEHPELDTSRARQNATLELWTEPSRALTLGLRGEYVTTLAPGELNALTGLAAGRVRGTRLTLGPSLERRFGPLTVGTAAWTETRDDLAGGVAAATRTVALGAQRRASPRDTLRWDYTYGRFDFEGAVPTTAHTLTLGWDRRITERTDLALRGGPRLSEGTVDPEVSIGIHHGSRRATLSLTYGRSLATVLGQSGTVITESLVPAVTFRPARFLDLSAAPGWYNVRGTEGGDVTRVRVASFEATGHLGPRFSLVGTYQRTLQEGILGVAAGGAAGGDEIARHTFLLRLVARGGSAPPAPRGGRGGEGPR
jgi:hypothetical protein